MLDLVFLVLVFFGDFALRVRGVAAILLVYV